MRYSEEVAERDRKLAEARGILDRADADLSGDDAARFDTITAEVEGHNANIRRLEFADRMAHMGPGGDGHYRTEGGAVGMHYVDGSFPAGGEDRRKPAPKPLAGQQVLTREQSMAQWSVDNGIVTTDEPVSFDRYIRGIVTGDWSNAEHERALSEGTSTAGGVLVPVPVANSVIDLARNQTRVFQAGAVTVPMTSNTLKMPRLTVENSPAWRNENATITPADLTFDAVTFTARSLARSIVVSRELFLDTTGDPRVGDVIAQSFAAQIAVELDRVALRGSGTPPEPKGVLNQSGVTITNHGAAGTALTNYDWLLDAAGAVRADNFEPTAHIVAPRTATNLGKLKETSTLAYMEPPAALLPLLPTSQVPVNLTVTTSSDCSEIYTGAWSMLGIGIRQGFEIQFLTEPYADTGQYGFIAHLRADVQCLQPAAFVVDLGVRG